MPREVLERNLRITPEAMHYGQGITTLASFLTNSSNNAAHPANGLAALYLATGQDIANIGESNQCTVYNRVTREGDYHFSITLPALIVASYGGGTNLPTQRECLKIMDCHGKGKALKLAEIAAAWSSPASCRWARRQRWTRKRAPTSGSTPTSVWAQPLTRGRTARSA
jgi:hydroxymethylglutaryl-CoA reductase (NADPH)